LSLRSWGAGRVVGEEQRQALPGRVRLLLDGVDVHAFAGDDAGLVVGAEASGGEVAGDLD
jgi:hypothetical protein